MRVENTDTQRILQNSICAVLCDVGGVLIHKRQTPELQQWAHAFHLETRDLLLSVWICSAGRRATLGQGSVGDVWSEIQQIYALTDTELEAFRHDFEVSDYVDTEFVQFLQDIRKTRKIALLSNAWPDARHSFGNMFGLVALADTMILSYEEGLAKPDRRIFELAAERLELPHESIVFIDDYPPNVSAAQACGMHGVIFETREQTMVALQAML